MNGRPRPAPRALRNLRPYGGSPAPPADGLSGLARPGFPVDALWTSCPPACGISVGEMGTKSLPVPSPMRTLEDRGQPPPNPQAIPTKRPFFHTPESAHKSLKTLELGPSTGGVVRGFRCPLLLLLISLREDCEQLPALLQTPSTLRFQ